MMADQGNLATHQPNCSYDVFLSFRGTDTRYSFTGFLYHALFRKGFKTFMDDEGLKVGNQISQALVNAIEESRISIVLFSENYASSTWCLDELVKILECMRLKNQLVWPIFYKMAPSDVRHQTNSYGEAMAAHEERFGDGSEKVQKWRSALCEAADLKGWHYETGYEYEFIEEIAKKVTTKLHREHLDVGEHVIGLESRIEEVKSLMDIESYTTVCMLGIHGIGGVGKTTLAMALYNSITHRFDCAIFLGSVREKSNSYMGLVHLQETILSKLFEKENIKLDNVGEGVNRLKGKLQQMKVLLVLDDVDSKNQLENLPGNCNWFGLGSRIIITTRVKDVLDDHKVEKRYEMKGLNDYEARQLFCWEAFKMSHPAKDKIEVSNHAVYYASGLPLALKVIGSHLANKSVKECECELKQYERIPNRKIQDILKISYDCLDYNAKNVFLDIACFFKGHKLQYVKEILEKCGLFPESNIRILIDKSLLAIDENDYLRMHDLIQDMGREIIRQEAPSKPGQRSRLYFHEDVLRVLRENSGSNNIEGIMLAPPEKEEIKWSGSAFKKMNNLRILIVRNTDFTLEPIYLPSSLRLLEWEGYPSKSLPLDFYPTDIVDLSLPYSHLSLEKEKPFQKLSHLTLINFLSCQFITHFPDVSGIPNLGELILDGCKNLIAIHPSVGFLKKLYHLSAHNCIKLEDFPLRMWLPSLKYLGLRMTNIEFFPHIEERMYAPLAISITSSRIKELPNSICNLMGLKELHIESQSLTLGGLPSCLFIMPHLAKLDLLMCPPEAGQSFRRLINSHTIATIGRSTLNNPRYSPIRILFLDNCGLTDEDLHLIFCYFPNLEILCVQKNEFVSIPTSIKECAKLKAFNVSYCIMLKEIPELPKSIWEVRAYNCVSMSPETSRMLWSQALNDANKLHVIMPQITEIPFWFDHRSKGGVVDFWARQRFPSVAVAFVFKQDAPVFDMALYINGRNARYIRNDKFDSAVKSHVFLFDLRWLYDDEEQPILDNFLVPGWNFVEVECENYEKTTYCRAYVYKKGTNMEDIRFTCPDPPKEHCQTQEACEEVLAQK